MKTFCKVAAFEVALEEEWTERVGQEEAQLMPVTGRARKQRGEFQTIEIVSKAVWRNKSQ